MVATTYIFVVIHTTQKVGIDIAQIVIYRMVDYIIKMPFNMMYVYVMLGVSFLLARVIEVKL